jgi:hypothetical protein
VKRAVDILALVVGLGFFAWVVSRFPLAAFAQSGQHMLPMIALSLAIMIPSMLCTAGLMWTLLDHRVPLANLIWVRLVAESYNALFASVGGEPFRIRYLTRWVSADDAVAAVVRDRVLDLTSGYVVSAGFIVAGVGSVTLPVGLRPSLLAYAAITSVVWIALSVLSLTRVPAKLAAPILRRLGAGELRPAPLPARLALRSLPWMLVARTLGLIEIWALIRVLGAWWSALQVGFADALLNAAGTVGFLVPQSLGVYEGSSVLVLGLYGMSASSGMAFGLAHRARMLLVGGLGIALHWAQRLRK